MTGHDCHLELVPGRSAGFSATANYVTPVDVASYAWKVLADSTLVAFIPVTDVAAACAFYELTLGLAVIEESPFALVVDANGVRIRVTPVPDFRPQPFTIAGWEVDDIEESVNGLLARGVEFLQFEGMDQSPDGVWASPSGDLVAWFVDPDRNTLSLTQFSHR